MMAVKSGDALFDREAAQQFLNSGWPEALQAQAAMLSNFGFAPLEGPLWVALPDALQMGTAFHPFLRWPLRSGGIKDPRGRGQ
jgi:hypothetical protein